jgi:putative mRNA 3-end processing factor
MQFTFHGAGKEVGRSCIILDNKFLIDAGIKIGDHNNQYPEHFDPQQIEATFISHAHLDHSGALPKLNHDGLTCPIFMTEMTALTTKVLLEDSHHIEMMHHSHPGYGKKHIFNVLQHVINVPYNKPRKINQALKATFFDAGHIPGSASILLEYKSKRILYTGDINHLTTHLLNGANYEKKIGKIDVMITESTYGDRSHPDRQQTEQEFVELIEETLEHGSVLIPAFAVGRAQELVLLLAQQPQITCPIYLDGMSRKILDLYAQHPKFVKDHAALVKAMKRIISIHGKSQRKRVLRKNAIIITTSGMVSGGPVMTYLKMMFNNPDNAILLTGFQGEGTNGRLLLEEKTVYVDGKRLHWRGRIDRFDFSAHAGQEELIAAIEQVRPTNLIIQHGDPIAIEVLGNKVKRFVKKTYKPEVGQRVTIE